MEWHYQEVRLREEQLVHLEQELQEGGQQLADLALEHQVEDLPLALVDVDLQEEVLLLHPVDVAHQHLQAEELQLDEVHLVAEVPQLEPVVNQQKFNQLRNPLS